jgi:CBS domain-containing protein
MKIAELMTASPEFCLTDTPVAEIARMMLHNDVGLIPVCESAETCRVVGCLTDRDIALRVVATGLDPRRTNAEEVMSRQLVWCMADDDACRAEELMQDNRVRRVLVLDPDGALEGVVSTADLARQHETRHVGETMQSISQASESPAGA